MINYSLIIFSLINFTSMINFSFMINLGGFMPRRPGLARVTREWADTQRDQIDSGASALILVELAVLTAQLADQARQEDDQRGFLSAASRLQQLIMAVERDSRSAGTGNDSGPVDDWSVELAEVLRSKPSLGDAA